MAERFIRHIIGFCLLLVRILNKLLSVPKSELCFICVRGRSWGNISEEYFRKVITDFSLIKTLVGSEGWENSLNSLYKPPTLSGILPTTPSLLFR